MHHFRKLSAIGALALMGMGAATLSASAATLGFQFTGTPVSQNDNATIATAYGYELISINTSMTLTGLGEFDDGSLSNVSQNGDTVFLGSGSAVPSSSNSFLADSLVHATITQSSTPTGTYWAFTSASAVLAAGDYWIAVVYGTPNTPTVFSTSAVTPEAGVTLGAGATCSQSNACSSSTATFGPNFEDVAATPLPAALPLFAGGLAMVGFLSRRRKRNAQSELAMA